MAAGALLTSCAGWRRVAAPADTTFAPRHQVQVWQGGKTRVLHRVRLTRDSIIGIPFQLPPTCDSCQVMMPRRDVDSLRVGSQESSAIVLAALPFIALYIIGRGLSSLD